MVMNAIEIHNEAVKAAEAAAKETLDKYGDRDACGFAWVNIKPGTSRFAKQLKAAGLARTDSYYGGVTVWNPSKAMVQSMNVLEAGAVAYAAVLEKHGIDARAMSRMD